MPEETTFEPETESEFSDNPSLSEVLDKLREMMGVNASPPTEEDYLNGSADETISLWNGILSEVLIRDAAWVSAKEGSELGSRVYRSLLPLHSQPRTPLGERINQDALHYTALKMAGLIATHYGVVMENGYLDGFQERDDWPILFKRFVRLALAYDKREITFKELGDEILIAIHGGWPEEDWEAALRVGLNEAGKMLVWSLDNPDEAKEATARLLAHKKTLIRDEFGDEYDEDDEDYEPPGYL